MSSLDMAGRRGGMLACLALAAILMAGCGANMRNQPRYTVYQSSNFFGDHSADRHLPAGVVPAGPRPGLSGTPSTVSGVAPVPVTKQLIERGRVEYGIACVPCHGETGYGNGMIVRRGYKHPPSFHIKRLRLAPDSHFYNVITNGYGAMPSYGYMVSPRDRWAIISYIRALQLSQNAPVQEVPTAVRGQFSGGGK